MIYAVLFTDLQSAAAIVMGMLSRGLWGIGFSFRVLGIEKAANGVLAAFLLCINFYCAFYNRYV